MAARRLHGAGGRTKDHQPKEKTMAVICFKPEMRAFAENMAKTIPGGAELFETPHPVSEYGPVLIDHIGAIPADTGRIALVDPCNADKVEALADCDPDTLATGRLGSVIVPAPVGDGLYPVYAERGARGEILRLIVDLDPDGIVDKRATPITDALERAL
jgi:hypothetical protein